MAAPFHVQGSNAMTRRDVAEAGIAFVDSTDPGSPSGWRRGRCRRGAVTRSRPIGIAWLFSDDPLSLCLRQVLDESEEFLAAIAMLACGIDQVAGLLKYRSAFRGSGDADPAASSELKQPLVAQ